MNVEGQLSGSSKGSYCAGAEREVWDEMPIHDVDVDGAHTGIFEPSLLLAQGTEIPAHDGGGNMCLLEVRVVGHFCGALTSSNVATSVTGTLMEIGRAERHRASYEAQRSS